MIFIGQNLGHDHNSCICTKIMTSKSRLPQQKVHDFLPQRKVIVSVHEHTMKRPNKKLCPSI